MTAAPPPSARGPGHAATPRGLSLAVEIGVVFMVLGLLPLAMIGWQYIRAAERQITDEIIGNMAVIADGRTQELESFARSRLREARFLASAPLVAQAVGALQGDGWGKGLNGDLVASSMKIPSAEERAAIVDPQSEADIKDRFRYYLHAARATMEADSLYLVAPDGSVVFAAGMPLGPKGQAALRSVFDRASTLLEPQLSTFIDEDRGDVVTLVGAPMLRDGAVQGVVTLGFGLDHISMVLTDYTGLGVTGETQVGGAVPGGVRLFGTPRFPAEAPLTGVIARGDRAEAPFLLALRGDRGDGLIQDYRGHRVLAAWRYLPSFDWALVVKVDQDERMVQMERLRTMAMVVLGTLVLLVLTLALFLARAISTPIRDLEVAAQQLSAGHMRELPVDLGPREVKSLARTFNDMAHRVHAYQSGLKRMVDERTAELRIAKEQAENATRAKSDFLAMMSHEIRTPLNGLLGVAELLDSRELDTQAKAQVRTIRQSGAALVELLNDILDISRVEAGKVDFLRDPFDLLALVEGITELMRSTADRKGVALTVEIDPDLPLALVGDPGRLRQVLLNLLGNAIKFTEDGRVTVVAAQRGRDDRAVLTRLTVRDTGIGVPAEDRDKLFQPFNQISTERSTRYGGAGLGLAICHRLVEGMGGVITHEPNPGGGSSFHVDLAFPLADPDQGRPSPSAVDAEAPPPPLSILLVEDEAVNRQVIEGFLAADGHVTRSVTNGADALELVETERFDLVLTDLRLPGLSGLDVARRVVARGGPPVIAVTANVMPEDRIACFAAGMVEVVAKPILSTDLRATIRRVWEGRSAPGPTAPPPVERAPEDESLLDPAYLEDMAEVLPPREITRLVDLAEESIRSALDRLVETASPEAAHRLAGAAGTYGLMRLRARAKLLEGILALEGDLDLEDLDALDGVAEESLKALATWKRPTDRV
jgi:signal transduction histidine kinase/CheY-like chemotaxis protein